MKRLRIVYTRHTETNDNAYGVYSGQRDTPLNARGIWQARELGKKFAGFSFRAIVSSDLTRAWQTAGHIGQHQAADVPMFGDPRLREVSLGSVDGKDKATFKSNNPGPRFDLNSSKFDFTCFGGENREQVFRRCRVALVDLAERFGAETEPYPTICIVGHGTQCQVLFEGLDLPPKALLQGEYREFLFPSPD